MSEHERSRDALNRRLGELAVQHPYDLDEWARAAMHLGDKAEALLPTVEALVNAGHRPLAAAIVSLELGPPMLGHQSPEHTGTTYGRLL